MTDPIELRRWVRLVLSALPRSQRASEALIFQKLVGEFPNLKVDEMQRAILWNQSLGYVDYRYDGQTERQLWALTDAGWKEEGLS